MLSRRRVLRALGPALAAAGAASSLLTTGCALTPRDPRSATDNAAPPDTGPWTGRLAMRMQAPHGEPLSFSAAFELRGSADEGELWLRSPIGSTIAQLRWQPGLAWLISDRGEQRFGSLQELTQALARALEAAPAGAPAGAPAPAPGDAAARNGTSDGLPLAELFGWLRGEAAPGRVSGWQLDDSARASGRLSARRRDPDAELRLVLDR